MSEFKTQLQRIEMLGYDAEYIFGLITEFPEGEWFTPTNANNQTYEICMFLYDCHLIEQRAKPMWGGGGYRGNIRAFRYKLDLKY